MGLSILTYDVSIGSGTLSVTTSGIPNTAKYVSFQAEGNGAVNGAVTVKLQESNVFGSTFKDVPSASATVNTSTSEYIDAGQFNSAYLQFDVAVGAATAGIITFTINYK